MQGTFVNLCYTMENHAIATMMTYFGSTDHGLGTEVDRVRGGGGTCSKNRLESPLIYIYIYINTQNEREIVRERERERERESLKLSI